MARSDAVWGIDIGQCALKALRCRPHEEPTAIVADAFDYIEYPKILSQPDADPAELVARGPEAVPLAQHACAATGWRSRCRARAAWRGSSSCRRSSRRRSPTSSGTKPGSRSPSSWTTWSGTTSGWAAGSEEEGFALETEVGLFAMKRDQVFRALEPFDEAGIEVDIVQLTPLALYNFVVFDQMQDLPPADEYDPENPPESVVVLSLGTDATDLVITNGYRVWQRSVPVGRQPLHQGADQGAEAHLRQGRAPEAQRRRRPRTPRPCSRPCGRCSTIC